jgi:hypothetical protein
MQSKTRRSAELSVEKMIATNIIDSILSQTEATGPSEY